MPQGDFSPETVYEIRSNVYLILTGMCKWQTKKMIIEAMHGSAKIYIYIQYIHTCPNHKPKDNRIAAECVAIKNDIRRGDV